MTDGDCIICNAPERYTIGTTDLSIATYFPRAVKRGHFVVATREHLPTFTDISPEQAADVFRFARELAGAAEPYVGAVKTYIAAIGDRDLHFHIHLFPKRADEPPMGPHIMSPAGWAGEVAEEVSEDEVLAFIAALRER